MQFKLNLKGLNELMSGQGIQWLFRRRLTTKEIDQIISKVNACSDSLITSYLKENGSDLNDNKVIEPRNKLNERILFDAR